MGRFLPFNLSRYREADLETGHYIFRCRKAALGEVPDSRMSANSGNKTTPTENLPGLSTTIKLPHYGDSEATCFHSMQLRIPAMVPSTVLMTSTSHVIIYPTLVSNFIEEYQPRNFPACVHIPNLFSNPFGHWAFKHHPRRATDDRLTISAMPHP